MVNKKIVCLGGGIGTVNLIKGLRRFFNDISVVVSMADDGGSTGRLRRLYNILPPGDLVSCMAALSNDPTIAKVITYRFPGDRYGKDEDLVGHKLGNLIMVGMRDITGNFKDAISLFKKTFSIPGNFFPATDTPVSISAKTIEGRKVEREENIDLGRYFGKKALDMVYLNPKNPKPAVGVIETLRKADVVVAGPGDLYTTILPTLIVPKIAQELKESKKKKFFIVNVANKPSETKGYRVSDYLNAIKKHLNHFPFTQVIVNNNFSVKIPKKYKYDYVSLDSVRDASEFKIIRRDLVDEDFPLYHDSLKLAKTIMENI